MRMIKPKFRIGRGPLGVEGRKIDGGGDAGATPTKLQPGIESFSAGLDC